VTPGPTGNKGRSMIICDLCGKSKDCLVKEIDGREYDICSECWNPLAQKLKGKGRTKNRAIVFLPEPTNEGESHDPKPPSGEPPIIWGASDELLNGQRTHKEATAFVYQRTHTKGDSNGT
jgi:hypothetical protein